MLQVIKRASVGDGRDERAELQGRHGNAFTKRAHLAHAAETGVEFMIGEGAKVLAFNAVTGKLAQTELVGVIADLGEAETAADSLKVSVVGVRERFSERHVRAAAERDLFLRGNNFFT